MSVITKEFLKKKQTSANLNHMPSMPFWDSYLAFAERQSNLKVVWFLKVIMVIPCVLMVPTIFLMAMITPNYLWFVGVTMVIFFANVITHIGEAKSTVYVPLYHLSILIMLILPLIIYLLNL